MVNGERSGTRGRSDWPVRIGGMFGGAIGAGIALLWRPDLGGFWPGLAAYCAMLIGGIILGQLVGRFLSRPSSAGSRNDQSGTS